ncbi:cytochrome C [Halarcobacter ebronensis]|uniref:Cytochrome C n=1 Tax=Halarcobacter ebronensis TaxID=1462615 RepID=A0A4Q0YHW1_9BACT|nr:cytochrome c3 family protein [Halarcobacter ebronensis]RXJ70266.1 cytochrome C [Halarcobacter ebronensis]
MKKVLILIYFISLISLIYANSQKEESNALSSSIKITPEIKKKYPLKHSHNKLSLDCIFCHEGQGDNPESFEAVDEDKCLFCHKSKIYLAKRLEFMDTLKANPHNSVHDGPNLYCDECHREHKPSVNMCSECHLKEIKNNIWMKDTP